MVAQVNERDVLGTERISPLAKGCVRHYPICPLNDTRAARMFAARKTRGALPVMLRAADGRSYFVGEWIDCVLWIGADRVHWIAAKMIVRDAERWPMHGQFRVGFTPQGALFSAEMPKETGHATDR